MSCRAGNRAESGFVLPIGPRLRAPRAGARSNILDRVTDNAGGAIIDVYTDARLDGIWPALCEAKSPTAFTRLLAPAVGLEPTTKRLTVARSTN